MSKSQWGLRVIAEDADATTGGNERNMQDALSRVDGTFVGGEGEDEGVGEEASEKKKVRKFDNPKVKTKPKKPTFRELQEKKMQLRKERNY